MQPMELLAPAGSMEALKAALNHGADAVYLGYTAFGARATAANFDREGLETAVRLCHARHVRVYVTVNTLVKEKEMGQVYEVLSFLNRAGVDAIILQDLGVAALARDCFPGLHRHASTQMSIHNAVGADFLKKEGFSRVVLARECSLNEIRKAGQTGIETEVFIHGAQCVSVSGQCLFSSMVGGRSGNRGRCAQPCRLCYDFAGQKGNWLSPRDLKLRDKLPLLQAAGVRALKIEGRLKRPEYVAVVTGAYRKALDALLEGRFEPANQEEDLALKQIFHRGGFMTGYAGGAQDAGVIDPGRVGHGGVPIGSVESLRTGFALVRVVRDLSDGDTLQFRGTKEEETIYSGKDVPAGDLALIRLREELRPRPGDQVARLSDARQMAQALAVKAPDIPVDAVLQAVPGQAAKLTVTDGAVEAEAIGEAVALAQQKPLTVETARKAIEKTGDTIFSLRSFSLEGENGFLPVSTLNSLRRDALASLLEKRIAAFGERDDTQRLLTPPVLPTGGKCPGGLLVQSADAELGQKLLEAGANTFLYAPESYEKSALDEAAKLLPRGSWLVLPVQTQNNTLSFLRDWAQDHRDILAGVVLGSIGQMGAGFTLPVAAGYGVPILNTWAAAELSGLGIVWQTVSPELSFGEIKDLRTGNLPFVLPVYGRTRLMVLNHCPARTALGLTSGHEACRLCDKGAPESLRNRVFTDRMGYRFPLERVRLPEGCLVNLLNALPLNLANQADKIRAMSWLLAFTTETPREQQEITASFQALRKAEPLPYPLPQGTGGHFHRGVE